MTLTARIKFKDPDMVWEILELFPEKDRGEVSVYFDGYDYGELELTIFAKDGVPCISAAKFVK